MSDLVGKTVAEVLEVGALGLEPASAARIVITAASYSAKRRSWQLAVKGPGGAGTVHIRQGLVRKEAADG